MAIAIVKAPSVSIVLPLRNEAAHISSCLCSILDQQEPPGGFEVVITDGMSDDGTREILSRLVTEVSGPPPVFSPPSSALRPPSPVLCPPPSVPRLPSSTALRVIDNPGRIVSTGLNAAIRAARGDIIVRLDAHTEYAPDYILRCVEAIRQSAADNVGGPARTKADSYWQEAVAAAYHSPFAVGGALFHDVDYEGYVDTVTYGCWRKSSFEKFGYFDEELVRNQDDEHNLRITRAGGKIWQSPKIKSWYKPRSSLPALFRQYMQYGYWKVRVIQKHKLPASWRHLVPGAFVLTLGSLLLLSVGAGVVSWSAQPQLDFLTVPISLGEWRISAFTLGFLAVLGSYLFAVLGATVLTAAKSSWKLLPALPLVFPCYHLGYGYGFLRGIWDFVIRRGQGSRHFQKLTR